MDLIASSYGDEEDEEDKKELQNASIGILPSNHSSVSTSQREAAAKRYVSKRERAAAAAEAAAARLHVASPPMKSSPAPLPPVDLVNPDLPLHFQKRVKRFERQDSQRSALPRGVSVQLEGHSKAVNAVRWSPVNGSLLASAGMDQRVYIWNVWSDKQQHIARMISSHTAAIKDIQWDLDGCNVLTCGFDQTSRLTDIETGVEKQVFVEDQYVNVIKFHPTEKELFVSGGSKGALKLWDLRTGTMVSEFARGLGQLMDLDFDLEGKRFVATSDIVGKNVSDKAITIWDFRSQIPLSNQVYLEAYTCPCVRYHPSDNVFVAQSNAGYIAIFSGHAPFKMNKYKRFEGHEVSGYRVQCNFSPDGGVLVTGSADGRIYFYHYRSTKILKVLEAHKSVCTDVSFNPMMCSSIASSGWDGKILVFE